MLGTDCEHLDRVRSGGLAGWYLRVLRHGCAVALALGTVGVAEAQDGALDGDLVFVPDLQAQLYRPSIDAESTLWTDDSGGRTDDLYTFARFGGNYVNHPFVLRYTNSQGETETLDLVSGALQFDMTGGVQLDRFRLGLFLPVYGYTWSDLADEGAGIGDLAVDARVGVLDRAQVGWGLALSGRLALATASVASPLGTAAGKPGWEVSVIADKQVGDVLIAANVGYRGIPEQPMLNVVWDDQLLWRVGAGWHVSDRWTVSADVAGAQVVRMLTRDPERRPSGGAGTPMEALGGARVRLGESLTVDMGAGLGLGQGIGAPAFRIVGGLGYRPLKPETGVPPVETPVADVPEAWPADHRGSGDGLQRTTE